MPFLDTQLILRITLAVIFLWLIHGLNPTQSCSELFINHLGTTTSDMSIQEGDSMEINCTLFTSSMDLADGRKVEINSKMLFFKYNGSRITNSKIQIVDNLTIRYKVDQASTMENGYYMCYVDIGETNVKPRAVCATYITIARAPSAIDNFNLKCSGYDLKNFTCSWDLQDYNIATTYDLSIVLAGDLIYSTCPKRIDKNSCTFSTSDKSPYLISDKKLKFRLDVSNKFGAIYKIFEIDHYSNVILDVIQSVYPQAIGPEFAFLNWDPPISMAHDTYLNQLIEYQLKVYPINRDEISADDNYYDAIMEAKYGKSFLIKELSHYNITDLIPFTRYKVKVRCRFVTNAGEGKWSRENFSFIETKPDLPYLYPILHPGAIELIQKKGNRQDVIIYFDKVDKMNINGPNFTYILKIRPFLMNTRISATLLNDKLFLIPSAELLLFPPAQAPSNDLHSSSKSVISFSAPGILPESISTLSEPIPSQSSSKSCRLSLGDIIDDTKFFVESLSNIESDSCIIENLDTSFDYRLEILSHNKIGFSPGSSTVLVPGKTLKSIHPGVEQLYAINWIDGNYTLYWTVSSDESIRQYTIVWCEIIDDISQCNSNLKHMDVSAHETSIELTIDFKRVKFGISVIDSNYGISSGIVWSSCIESGSFTSVKNRFKRFNIISDGSNSIHVAWKLDCPALDHFIDHYEIRYCQVDHPCSNTLTVINIGNLSTEYNIDNLESNTGYNVTIRVVTIRGERLESPTITIETKVNVLSFTLVILIIIAGIVSIFLIIYTLAMCTLRKRKDEKKLKESVDSNWIPKMPSRLKGDANILLNPLPRNEYENKEYMNSNSNTNINKLNSVMGSFDQQLTKIVKNNNNNIVSTISRNHQLNDICPLSLSSSSSATEEPDEGLESMSNHKNGSNRSNLIKSFSSVSSSSSKKQRSRKLSDGGGCDSEDSGYSTKLADKNCCYKGDTFTINGLIKSIDDKSSYIVVPESKNSGILIERIENSSKERILNSNNYATINQSLSDSDLSCNDQTSSTINNNYQPKDYIPFEHGNESNNVNTTTISNGYVYA